MIVKSIELSNIRSYLNQKVEFNEGINFLSGDIGSGKSTILHAIEFALFGFKKGDLEGHHLLRKGEREASVTLNLTDNKNNINLEIFRKIKKGKSNNSINQENGYIKINENLEELSPQELNSQIFDLLNFPKEFLTKDKNLIYRFTIYTPQEQLKEILFATDDKKLEVIRKIFGIDKYKQLNDAISIYLSNLKTNKKVLDAKLENFEENSKEIKNIEKEIKELNEKLKDVLIHSKPLKEKLEKCENAISKRDEFLEKLNGKKLTIEKNLNIIDKSKNEIQEINEDMKNIQKEIKENNPKKINEQIKELENKNKEISKELLKLEKNKNKIFKTKKEIEKLNKERETINLKLNNINNQKNIFKLKKESSNFMLVKCQVKDIEKELNKINQSLKKSEDIKKAFEKLSNEIIKTEFELKNIKKEINEKNKSQDEIKDIKTCPICQQEVNTSHKNHLDKKLKEEINLLKSKEQKLFLDLNNNQKKVQKLEKTILTNNEYEKKQIEVNQKWKHLVKQEEKEKELNEEIKVLENNLKKNEENKLIKETDNINKKLKEFSKNEEEIEKIRLEENKINKEISQNNLTINELKNKIENLKKSEENIDNLKIKLEKRKSILEKEKVFESKKLELKNKEKQIKEDKLKFKSLQEKLFQRQNQFTQELSITKTHIENKNQILEEKQNKEKEGKENQKKLKKLIHNEIFLTKRVSKIAELIEKITFTKYYSQFNEEFEELFKELIEDNEIEVRLDELFSIIIEQNGYDIDIKNLSGGEKSSLAIAYRLGLKKIIENNLGENQRLKLLILDEPTDGFSNEQVDRLGQILKESDLEQIILVSHDEKIESISNYIHKVSKTNHISEVQTI